MTWSNIFQFNFMLVMVHTRCPKSGIQVSNNFLSIPSSIFAQWHDFVDESDLLTLQEFSNDTNWHRIKIPVHEESVGSPCALALK